MKAMKSERAKEIVSMDWDKMIAKTADGQTYRFEVVLTKLTGREVALKRLAGAAPAHPGEQKEGEACN